MSERAHKQIDYVIRLFEDQVLAARRYVDSGKAVTADEDYEFLKQFVVGRGLDICCGDFLIEGAIGVDKWLTLGSFMGHSGTNGENLPMEDSTMDFVVTNYPEVFSDIPRTFKEWHRVLKPGAPVAIVARDADHSDYAHGHGVLHNRHRNSCFTRNTLRMYLCRAGFVKVKIDVKGTALYAIGRKG